MHEPKVVGWVTVGKFETSQNHAHSGLVIETANARKRGKPRVLNLSIPLCARKHTLHW
jgi:hypothetical protein